MPEPSAPEALARLDDYDLIVDARSPREFAEDHIPGAVNWPVVDDQEYAAVGTTHRTDTHRAYLMGVAWSLRRMADRIETDASALPRSARVLVYCFRGGKRSRLWHDNLSTIGFRAERLAGGWKGYRRWVMAQLDTLPAAFTYHVLVGPTGAGKTRLLAALARAGAQSLDLEAIACHRGSVLGDLPGTPQPTQKLFDSALAHRLRALDPARPVWVESESKRIGAVQLPESMFRRMHAGRLVRIATPMPERIRMWHEDYPHFAADLIGMVAVMARLRPIVGGQEYEHWQRLAQAGDADALFEHLMSAYYDPLYERSLRRNYAGVDDAPLVSLDSLAPEALDRTARELLDRMPDSLGPR